MKIILLILLVACGSSNPGDPPLDDGSNPLADAAGPANLTEMPLSCVTYAREVRHAATDNSRDVTLNRIATVALAPGSDFVLSTCDAPIVPTCGGGNVCTGEAEPPATKICDVKRGSASFYDGQLTILCGTRTEHVLASGTLQSFTETTFSVKLEIFQ